MHVLICDDEPSIRLLFRTAIEDLGGRVSEAPDGPTCLALATATSPDVIVLDVLLPGPDGLAILPSLLTDCPGAAVFVVSAHAGPDTFQQALALGATACFDKLHFLDRLPALLTSRQLTA